MIIYPIPQFADTQSPRSPQLIMLYLDAPFVISSKALTRLPRNILCLTKALQLMPARGDAWGQRFPLKYTWHKRVKRSPWRWGTWVGVKGSGSPWDGLHVIVWGIREGKEDALVKRDPPRCNFYWNDEPKFRSWSDFVGSYVWDMSRAALSREYRAMKGGEDRY